MKLFDEVRRDAVNAKSDELFKVNVGVAEFPELLDEFGRGAVDAKGNKFVGVEAFEIFRFDSADEIETDIHDGHEVLVVFVHNEAERLHLLRVVGVRHEVKDPCAFTVFQVALAIEAAGVARDTELRLLPARLGEIDALERPDRPVGRVMGMASVLMSDQGKLHLAGLAGATHRPIAGTGIGGAHHQNDDERASNEHVGNEGLATVHGDFLLFTHGYFSRTPACFSSMSFSKSRFLKPWLCASRMNSGVMPATFAEIKSSGSSFRPAACKLFTYSGVTPWTFIPISSSTVGFKPST